jgi:hypothetical protein
MLSCLHHRRSHLSTTDALLSTAIVLLFRTMPLRLATMYPMLGRNGRVLPSVSQPPPQPQPPQPEPVAPPHPYAKFELPDFNSGDS